MKPEPASALFAGPFALATLSAPDGPEFPALVTPDALALDLRTALGDDRSTVRSLEERRAEAAESMDRQAAEYLPYVLDDSSARDLRSAEMKVGLGPCKGKETATTPGFCPTTADDTVSLTVEGIGTPSSTVVPGVPPVPRPAGRRRNRERP